MENDAFWIGNKKKNRMSSKQEVKSMFDKVAGRYDFLNHFLSVGIDYYWRKVTIKRLGKVQPKKIPEVKSGEDCRD